MAVGIPVVLGEIPAVHASSCTCKLFRTCLKLLVWVWCSSWVWCWAAEAAKMNPPGLAALPKDEL